MLFPDGYSTNNLETPSLLPLYHSTMSNVVDLIVDSGEIATQRDSISTVFFFYGKPSYSYRPKSNRFQPFCFIFNGNTLIERGEYVSIHCFDTGGLSHGHYEPEISSAEPANGFQIGRNNDDLRKACRELFETNERYLSGQCREDAEFGSFFHPRLKGYVDLVKKTSDLRNVPLYDPPAHTFEVQVRSPIRLLPNAKALMGPQDELSRLIEFLEDNDIEPIPYGSDHKVSGLPGWLAMMDLVKSMSKA
ncbi:hypothetical protein [Rhizobium laguerreae]|uniref:hypothetical protein n=1 Tax=Rhizobium laguerreae TaxID=1076926 RepID=UPI001C907D71|nr:hypothetical protein [Rhizobium laguerreae]MBY3483363.1 hypothetical protein [Rhizobium laguerreae]